MDLRGRQTDAHVSKSEIYLLIRSRTCNLWNAKWISCRSEGSPTSSPHRRASKPKRGTINAFGELQNQSKRSLRIRLVNKIIEVDLKSIFVLFLLIKGCLSHSFCFYVDLVPYLIDKRRSI